MNRTEALSKQSALMWVSVNARRPLKRVSFTLLPSLILALSRENIPASVSGQATQDGSFLLSVHPLPYQRASPTPYLQLTDLPMYLSWAPARDCFYQRAVSGVYFCWFPW